MSVDHLERAAASTRAVLKGIAAEDLDRDTPCASWKVRDLLNHVLGGTHVFANTVRTGEMRPPEGGRKDFCDGDLVATFDEGAAQAVEAFAAPGAAEKMLTLPFGQMPAGVFVNIAATDVFQHGWDVAKATGQSTDLDPDLARELLVFAQGAIPEAFRGEDGTAPFGRAVEVSATAPPADQLAGFLGRHP